MPLLNAKELDKFNVSNDLCSSFILSTTMSNSICMTISNLVLYLTMKADEFKNLYCIYKLFFTTDISQIISKVPTKKDVVEVLMCIKHKWYMIGTALEVSSGDLDSLKFSNNPVEENLAIVISNWLDKHPKETTWEVLLKAVEGKIVESPQTGLNIREFLKRPDLFYRYVQTE